MPWQQTLQEINARMERLGPQIQQLNNSLNRSVLQYEHFNALVGEANAQILDRVKILTGDNVQGNINRQLNTWNDATINTDITRAQNYAQQAAQERTQFEQGRANPTIAQLITSVHSETQALSVNRLQTLQREVQAEAPGNADAAAQVQQLRQRLAEDGMTIDQYANDLQAARTPATATMTAGELVSATPSTGRVGQGGTINQGEPNRGRLGNRNRVDVPDRNGDDSRRENHGGDGGGVEPGGEAGGGGIAEGV